MALGKFLPQNDVEILDFGGGTRVSGLALKEAGFSAIDGIDLSPEMLQAAASHGVYRSLILTKADAPPSFTRSSYAAITPIGALSLGIAPAIYLDHLIKCLAPGGLFSFSYNENTLADASYTDQLAQQLSSGAVRKVFQEEGDHISERGSKSIVYVLRKQDRGTPSHGRNNDIANFQTCALKENIIL